MGPAMSSWSFPFSLAIGVGLALIGIVFYALSMKDDLNSEEDDETEGGNGGEIKFSILMNMLESEDEHSLLNALNKLSNLTAFQEFQALVREYGGLAKISSLVNSSSSNVKMQALNVLNNLAMDVENQRYLKNLIPDLTHMLRHDSDTITLTVARVLTNLTALDENHGLVIPHVSLLLEVLHASDFPIKLQVLKILVNLSTNSQVTENELELAVQIIRGVGDFVDSSCDGEIVLRSVTCLANVFSALRNRWQNRHRSQISTAEFVPENMELRLKELQHHENENIVWHTERALAALQPSVGGETPRTSEKIDLIELLQL